MEDLAKEYDVVVIGTGPSESFVSGAVAESGKTLINLDKNGEYGGCRRTFNLREFVAYCERSGGEIITNNIAEVLGQDFRQSAYNIDLMPLMVYANDKLIQVLIDSQSQDSVRITTVEGLYFPGQGKFRRIPCSKQAIFVDQTLSLPQKKAVMNFITAFLPDGQYGHIKKHEPTVKLIADFESKPFAELLAAAGFDKDLSLAFEYFVASATEPLITKDAIPRIKQFVGSIGKYCATPFITFIYGSSDVPQVFARHSAVYGGIYVLKHMPEKIEKQEDGTFVLQVPEIGTIKTKQLVVGGDQVNYPEDAPKRIIAHREVILAKQNLVPESRSIIVVPPGRYGNEKPVWIIQFDSTSSMCSEGQYLLHFISMGDVRSTADRLLEVNPDLENSVILRASFILSEPANSPIDGTIFLPSPSAEDIIVGSDFFVDQSKEALSKISPDIPFYPVQKEQYIEITDEMMPEQANATEAAPQQEQSPEIIDPKPEVEQIPKLEEQPADSPASKTEEKLQEETPVSSSN